MGVFKLIRFYLLVSIIASISSVQAMEIEEKFQDQNSKLCFKKKRKEMKRDLGAPPYKCIWYNENHKFYAFFMAPGPLPDMSALDQDVIANQKLILSELKDKLQKPNFGLHPINNNPKPLLVKPEGNAFMKEFNERLKKKRKEIEEAECKEQSRSIENNSLANLETTTYTYVFMNLLERFMSFQKNLRSETSYCNIF